MTSPGSTVRSRASRDHVAVVGDGDLVEADAAGGGGGTGGGRGAGGHQPAPRRRAGRSATESSTWVAPRLAEGVVAVGPGAHACDQARAGPYAAQHVVRGVADDGDLADGVGGLGAQERLQHHVRGKGRPRPPASAGHRVSGDQAAPAEGAEDGVLGDAGEAGAQDDGASVGGQFLDGLAGAGDRGDQAAVDEFAVRLLEGGVGVLGAVLVAEQVPEDGDLGLAHGGADVVELLGVVVRAGLDAQFAGGGVEGARRGRRRRRWCRPCRGRRGGCLSWSWWSWWSWRSQVVSPAQFVRGGLGYRG